jgi:beta-glucosidase
MESISTLLLTVMSAYNAVNGFFCSENSSLLTDILKDQWKFTGLLMSDFNAIHDGLNAAIAGCDIDLPAGNFMNAKNLLPFIPSPLPVSAIDDKVRRILREVISFGYLDRQQQDTSIPLDDPFSETASLNIAREGIILLQNAQNLLPLQKSQVRSIAVLGPAAQDAPPTGFGSSYVTPINFVSELDGIKSAASPGKEILLKQKIVSMYLHGFKKFTSKRPRIPTWAVKPRSGLACRRTHSRGHALWHKSDRGIRDRFGSPRRVLLLVPLRAPG